MQIRQNTPTGTKQLYYTWNQTTSDQQDGKNARKTVFVVESNQIRRLQDIPASEDVEITSCPVIDYNQQNLQGQSVLGRSYAMQDWPQSGQKYISSLTAVRTANPYFADFQTQNGSVFSFFDNLAVSYNNSQWQLANAQISYSIIGYYPNPLQVDPLAMPLVPSQTPQDRLDACQMQLKSTAGLKASTVDWLQNGGVGQMRGFCAGSFNNIYWNICRTDPKTSDPALVSLKASVRFPGDAIQNAFDTAHPLAVGTNALDSLFGWLSIPGQSVPADIRAQLLRLQSYVLDINDNLDSQLQAEDLIATNNFVPTPCGTRYHFADPSTIQDGWLQNLIDRNAQQSRYDSLLRQYEHFKADMFSLWWKFVCDDGKSTTADPTTLKNAVQTLQGKMKNNQLLLKGGLIKLQSPAFEAAIQPSAEVSFYMQRDPTLLVAGLQSAWPKNINDKVNVRLQEQISPVNAPPRTDLNPNSLILAQLRKKVDSTLYSPIAQFWEECDRLSGADNYFSGYDPPANNSLVNPDFHDDKGDQWTTTNDNGWFPLFIEWEIEYYNIPWEHWQFAPHGDEGRFGYGLKDGVDLVALGLADDYLVINGRSPVLPQASAVLETALKQVFAKVNPDVLDETIPPTEHDPKPRDTIIDAVRKMDFLSTAMSGLTDQLITRMQGTHATPLAFQPGVKEAIIPQAILSKATSISMTRNDFLTMDSGSTTTPFASLVPVLADTSKYSPFKPVTHGQFRFTKFNIIDKFGQMVQGIKLTNDLLTDGKSMNDDRNHISHTPLFPCLSENYSLESFSQPDGLKGLANAVLRRADGLCSFVQLPPSINQPARVNADFVTAVVPGSSQFRRLEDNENPCKGYLVINYANASFQVFTTLGQFVREYSVRNGKVASLPFAPNAQLSADLDPLLQTLLKNFTNSSYLVDLFENISTTVEAVQANPSHAAESMLSILGRPLALVTFGVSLELEGPPLSNDSTIKLSKPAQPTDSVTGYDFAIKLGDRDNVFDGMYGFFTGQSNGSFDMDTFYSYHDPDPQKQPQPTTLKPFYIDPVADDYAVQRNLQYKTFAALVDPFTPLHCYTALLPIKQLVIPPWALQDGVSRIASFFKIGPILSPVDVPAFDAKKEVAEDYRLDDKTRPVETGTLAVPAISVADWSWLQPFWDGEKTRYNLLGLQNVDAKPRYEQPPYVATEGYLQMKKSFVAPDSPLGG